MANGEPKHDHKDARLHAGCPACLYLRDEKLFGPHLNDGISDQIRDQQHVLRMKFARMNGKAVQL
jgi:hypothetical protein